MRGTGSPTGRQFKKRIRPAWTSRGRPAAGYYTKRTAEAWLSHVLDQARRGTLPSTVRDYQSIIPAHLLPAFGTKRLEDITTEGVERWAVGLTAGGRMNNRTKLKILTVLHGVMGRARRVWKLPRNPVTDVEKPVQTHRTDIDVFSPEDVMALVRAAASGQDGAIYLTAAFTRLRRGELVTLRWRRLCPPAHPRHRQLHRAIADDADVRQGPFGAARARRRRGARAPRPARRVRARTTLSRTGFRSVDEEAPHHPEASPVIRGHEHDAVPSKLALGDPACPELGSKHGLPL
jgi:integrase